MLHQLYVQPDRQRAGIGAQLLGEIEASFPEARRIVLEVEAANAKGVAFYRKHGFVEAGTSTRRRAFLPPAGGARISSTRSGCNGRRRDGTLPCGARGAIRRSRSQRPPRPPFP